MGFFVAFLIGLAFTVVGELLRPKQKVPNAKASAYDEFEIPTAEEGRSITVFCGKVLITGSNVTWSGDLRSTPLKQKVKTGLWSSERQTYAHRCFMGFQHVMGFGDASVEIHRILWGDYENEPNHTREVQADGSTRITYNDEKFYGGDKEEGGLSGVLHFYPGNDVQEPNAYMTGVLGEQFPGYRSVCHAIIEGMYIGTQKYIKAPAFEASRYPNQLAVADDMHIIGEDCNPVCFMFELLTNQVWGVGKPASDIDLVAWRAVAETVFNEGFGVSMIYNGSASADQILSDILRHIDGVIFPNPSTGLLTIRLARHDYVKADLPHYDARDIQGGIKFSRPSWSETKNTLTVTYTNRERNYDVGSTVVQDLANIMVRGGELTPEEISFDAFTTLPPVQAAAARASRVLAYPLAKGSVTLNRRARKTLPADVIRITWPELGLADVVFRVTNVDRSAITQNLIGLELVEDIFSLAEAAYDLPAVSEWVNPVGPPSPLARQAVIEAPYFVQGGAGSNVLALGTRAGGLDLGYTAMMGPDDTTLVETMTGEEFSSSALLSGSIDKDDTTFAVTGALGLDETNQDPTDSDRLSGDTLVLLKSASTEEFVAYDEVAGSTYSGVMRGLLDTVQQDHPSGTQAWFLTSGFEIINQQPFAEGFPIEQAVKLLPYNVLGALPEDNATAMTIELTNRAARPYPPGRIRVDAAVPGAAVSDDFVLTWAHRNRLAQAYMVSQDDASVTPEPGVGYIIRLYDAADALIDENTSISGAAVAATINVNYTGDLTVEITSVRDGLESYQPQRFTIAYTGTGTTSIVADEPSYVLDGGGA